jgi:hypothetical protein
VSIEGVSGGYWSTNLLVTVADGRIKKSQRCHPINRNTWKNSFPFREWRR